MESRLNTITGNPDSPIGLPEAFDDHMTITYNLMHLAWQGDMTRVFTFMIGHEPTDRSYAHIGCPETHHSISHHGNDQEKLTKYAKIGTYQIVKFAEFLDKLKATPEGDGSLLDHSMVYWGSGMSNGNAHDRSNPPAVIVGGAHGRLQGNRHIAANDAAVGEPAARTRASGGRGDRAVRRKHRSPRPVAALIRIRGARPTVVAGIRIGRGSQYEPARSPSRGWHPECPLACGGRGERHARRDPAAGTRAPGVDARRSRPSHKDPETPPRGP